MDDMASEGIGVDMVESESRKRTAAREAKKGNKNGLKRTEREMVKRDERNVRKLMEIRAEQAREDWL